MFGAIASALSGVGSIVGSLIGSDSQKDTNQASAAEAQKNRDFAERMSSTSYQRATADMRAAGLNPMLAYAQGGESSPPGSMASFTAPNQGLGIALSQGLSQTVSSARDLIRLRQDILESRTRSSLNMAAASEKLTNVSNLEETQLTEQTKRKLMEAQSATAKAVERDIKSSLPAKEAKGAFEHKHRKVIGPLDSVLNRLLPSVETGAKAGRDVGSLISNLGGM